MLWRFDSEWPGQPDVSRCFRLLRIDQILHGLVPGRDRRIRLPCILHSVGRSRRRALWPIDRISLELQPHGEVPVGKPLTVHNASNGSKIADKRINHQSFVQCSSTLGQYAHSQRADVFCCRPFGRSWVQDAGNLQRERQPNPLFKSSRPSRHL